MHTYIIKYSAILDCELLLAVCDGLLNGLDPSMGFLRRVHTMFCRFCVSLPWNAAPPSGFVFSFEGLNEHSMLSVTQKATNLAMSIRGVNNDAFRSFRPLEYQKWRNYCERHEQTELA